MRLINTTTLILHEFFDRQIPHYAILSHVWGPEEVTFQDWLYVTKQNPARWGWVYVDEEVNKIKAKTGYQKIVAACWQASAAHFAWIWIDTNCIDKTNSAELSEAINSMFRWYQNAVICYVYLADVAATSVEECVEKNSAFRRSRWFERGWTLQELIAPKVVAFFSFRWVEICRRSEIAATLQEITKIPVPTLAAGKTGSLLLGPCSAIAETMSWAAQRETTRVEDTAYCLLGLFDINMPLLYGEGSKAFLRLQLEITQRTTDLSFLAWQHDPSFQRMRLAAGWTVFSPTFTSTPAHFGGAGSPCLQAFSWAPINLRVTNLGLSLRLPLVDTLDPNLKFAVLIPLSRDGRAVWMPLWKSGHQHIRLGFISTTLVVPRCPLDLEEEDIILPIHANYLIRANPKIDVSSLYQRSRVNILLAFPLGLRQYQILDKVSLSPPRGVAESTHTQMFSWGDLLLGLVESKFPRLVYGAVEFEFTTADPSRPGTMAQGSKEQRVAILFKARVTEAGRPINWTCADISHLATGNSTLFLQTRAYMGLRIPEDLDALDWRQQCSLTAPAGDRGHVIMDDIYRDLSAPEFGGYGPADTGKTSDGLIKRVDQLNQRYFPIHAQIVLPLQDGSGYAPSRAHMDISP